MDGDEKLRGGSVSQIPVSTAARLTRIMSLFR